MPAAPAAGLGYTAAMTDPAFLVLLALAAAVVGAVAGTVAGLLGVGGGIVVVPLLYLALGLLGVDGDVRMHVAVATSLATLVPTAWSSSRAHHRRGAVDLAFLRSWGPWILAGSVAGAVAGGHARPEILTLVFGVVALAVAAYMGFVGPERRIADTPPSGAGCAVLAASIGGVSVMMGIGGGTVAVPTLTLFNYPIRRAIGTASAIGLLVGVPGAVGFVLAGLGVPDRPPWSLGYLSLPGFLLLAPAQALAAPWGARLAHSLPQPVVRRLFGAFLAVAAARMLYAALA